MILIYDYETAFANNGELSWLLYKQNVNKDVFLFKENRKLDLFFGFFYRFLPSHRQADSDSLSP